MKKYTLIIGSGIHMQGLSDLGNAYKPMKSWDDLLGAMNISGYYSPLLGFEKRICENAGNNNLSAKESEKLLLKNLSKEIKSIQDKILDEKNLNYPLEIFNPQKVGNVIILNFDLVIEKLLAQSLNLRNIRVKKTKSGEIRYREINGIKFWHPHGDIESPSKIQFGLRKYGYNIQDVEYLRGEYKKADKDDDEISPVETTWLSALIEDPLVFIGTGMAMEEWTLWYALATRQRNFARRGDLQPVYTLNRSDAYCKMHAFLQVNPISESLDYNAAWKDLVKFLS
jgi:hypothetical protein